MNEELFAELLDSVREGAEILQGKREPARTHHIDPLEAVSFLQEQRHQVLGQQLEILAHYQVNTPAELEAKIANGEVAEHPGWEDLITTQNLAARLEKIDTLLGTP